MYSPLNVKLEVGETRHIDHISWGFELKAFLGSNALGPRDVIVGQKNFRISFLSSVSTFSCINPVGNVFHVRI